MGDEVAIFLDEGEDLVVVLGDGVTDATALDDFEGLQIEFYHLYPFAVDSGGEDEEIGLEVIFASKDTVVHRCTFLQAFLHNLKHSYLDSTVCKGNTKELTLLLSKEGFGFFSLELSLLLQFLLSLSFYNPHGLFVIFFKVSRTDILRAV